MAFDRFYIDLLSLKTEMQYRGYSPSTQETYSKTVESFLNYINKEVIDIKREDIIFYLDMSLQHLDINTILVKLNALEFFFEEILGLEITANIRKYKRRFKVKEFITPEEFHNLIASVYERERITYKIFEETAMTIEEIVALKIDDLKYEKDGSWKIKSYSISRELAREITDYYERKYLETYLFPLDNEDGYMGANTARYWLRKNTEQFLGRIYSFNDIKHGLALEMIKRGDEKGAARYLKNKTVAGIRQYYKRAGYDYMKEDE